MKPIKFLTFFSALIFCATACAEEWELMPKLRFSPSETLDITYQSGAHLGFERDLIFGWKGDEPDFFVVPLHWEPRYRGYKEWGMLLDSIKSDPKNSDVKVDEQKAYDRKDKHTIRHRLVEYREEGELRTQLFTTIGRGDTAFMLFATSISGDKKYLLKNLEIMADAIEISE